MTKSKAQIKKINENLILWKLRASENRLKGIHEVMLAHNAKHGTFTGSNIEDLINVTAELKQLAIELELFVKANYRKETQ